MKGQRPRRKVIVFLVDGQSDQNALSIVFASLYSSIDESYEVFFPPLTEDGTDKWGDLTSKYGINPATVEKCIEKLYFTEFLRKKKLYPKDISEIVHIVDLDGVYVEDTSVVFGPNPTGADKPYYTESGIITTNVNRIIERNTRKRDNLDYLCHKTAIKIGTKKIPYSLYYFSCNLDHVLHNDANIQTGYEKVARADQYAMTFVDNPEGFVQSIEATPGTMLGYGYNESWSFIRERGLNSVHRHTNINVLFNLLRESQSVESPMQG